MAYIGRKQRCIQGFGESKTKRPLEGPRRRWENNFNVDIK